MCMETLSEKDDFLQSWQSFIFKRWVNQIVEATNICNAIITLFYALGACRKIRQITPWELVVKYVKLRLGYT